jgi:ATP-dependent Zn protease
MAEGDYPLPMASEAGTAPSPGRLESDTQLSDDWRRLGRAATAVAVITAPVAFTWFHNHNGWGLGWSLVATILEIAAFRGVVDVILRRVIPWPSLFGTDDARLRAEDAINRRRAWYWRKKVRLVFWAAAIVTFVWLFRIEVQDKSVSWTGTAGSMWHGLGHVLSTPSLWVQVVFVGFLFLSNFLIFMGPMMLMGISQIRAFEPGDAEWGVKLDDVRGQAEAKEEIRQVVNLWQSGEAFERAGGKRERGVLFRGAPGTGKTMLAKAIATGFNSPFVTIPGSGFAQTFIGIDVLIVRFLAAKARRLARKWGGTCIVFIDEIDAVAMRRQSLGASHTGGGLTGVQPIEDFLFFGPNGALNPSGDLILETRAWRERLFEQRAPAPRQSPALVQRVGGIVNQVFPGMMGGMGQMALNQLLVVMDGIDNPPFTQRVITNRVNTFLDALYIVPQRMGKVPLRLPRARPSGEQIYFIGATNVPMEALDPALTRPGRMGRHVWFRTPTKQDRLDIFDLYLGKVSHDADLDRPERRDELARVTNGYSPAMIDQVCSMALTIAHHDFRERFGWTDIVEAMTTVESGTAVNIEYIPEETRAVAIHEAGHAIAAHVYMRGAESTRLSIRMRGGSLGHHQARERDERFSAWRHELQGRLVWGLGAMAAERVFYGENSNGVGGDVQTVTATAAYMVGSAAMGPDRIEIPEGKFDDESVEETRKRLMKRFEQIGLQIMNRTGGGGPFAHDPIASVLSDQSKRAMAAQILGQAYMQAHHLVLANKPAVEHVADELVERREIHGDEVVNLLDRLELRVPQVDVTDEEAWPNL